MKRRTFIAGALAAPLVYGKTPSAQVLGQGEHRYRVVPNWGNLDPGKTPVKNGSAIVSDREGHTDLNKNTVVKTSLDGEVLQEYGWPASNGKYQKAKQYRPAWTLHAKDGTFFVLDGYGQDFIMHYTADGKLTNTFGGKEGGVAHWGPHGGMVDEETDSLLIAMSDQQMLQRIDFTGKTLEKIALPGSNPRQIQKQNGLLYIPHLADNWPDDRSSRGYLSVLDKNLRVISNIGGTPPEYSDQGTLQKMKQQGDVFLHPHDLVVDDEDSIYVAQFASNQTYPIKLERI